MMRLLNPKEALTPRDTNSPSLMADYLRRAFDIPRGDLSVLWNRDEGGLLYYYIVFRADDMPDGGISAGLCRIRQATDCGLTEMTFDLKASMSVFIRSVAALRVEPNAAKIVKAEPTEFNGEMAVMRHGEGCVQFAYPRNFFLCSCGEILWDMRDYAAKREVMKNPAG